MYIYNAFNIKFIILRVSFILFFVSQLLGQEVSKGIPLHHTESGFKNNYLPEERMSKSLGTVFKWRFTRNSQEKVKFESVEPDIEFLKSNKNEETLTWIGHSTFLWQFGGINLITDPHLNDRASPVGFAGPKRIMKPAISLDDLPELDVVIISHNHYDHLDKKSVLDILKRHKGNPPLFLVPLGMKEWFADIGIKEKVVELDWWQSYEVGEWKYHAVPVQHWSRRGLLDTNEVLWCGWVVEAPEKRFFFAGDTGYSNDFKDIGRRFPQMDLSLIPIGAYAPRWFMKDMHCNPEEAVQIHLDVNSQKSIGMHWGTFLDLTDEPLEEPPLKLAKALKDKGIDKNKFITMKHGETLKLR
jgi:N-acyl-phosphatidylethanolamine-hydrolysing phospholipase D